MKIITLSREYGAGGHSVGLKVAEKLGVEFYDKDIIAAAAKELGLSNEEFGANEEKITKVESILRSISPISYDQKDAFFNAEKAAIISIAKKGPCVILGRCSDAILADAGIETLNVFLYADEQHREKRVGEILGTDSITEIHKAIRRTDAQRHSYYYNYTGRHWAEVQNYDLVINTGAIGYEKAVEIICKAAEE